MWTTRRRQRRHAVLAAQPTEIGLLSHVYWGLPARAHTARCGWAPDQLGAADTEDRLADR